MGTLINWEGFVDYRVEALEKLKDNNVSLANMEVWIAGYIAGREDAKCELKEIISEKNALFEQIENDTKIYGYTQFKDLQENL